MEEFVWTPGDGIDLASLSRIRLYFRRPNEPMGEAWFMSEARRFFHELNGDLDGLTAWNLQEPLQEIASGTSSFGPNPEWHAWYHYLLGALLPRSHEYFVSPLSEFLVTGFIALHPNGVHKAPYPEFRDDALRTLGRCLMAPECWNGGEVLLGSMLHRSNNNPNEVWCWWDASGDFSASLFFCLKYLPPSHVRKWFASVLQIGSAHWRAQVIAWLVGAHDLLEGRVNWPSEWKVNARPSVSWEWSHCLRPELATSDDSGATAVDSLIPEAARFEVLTMAKAYFSPDVFLEWLESISCFPYLEAELAEIPSTFENLYVHEV